MYRHPKSMTAFYNMMEKFEAEFFKWIADQGEGYVGQIELSNSCVASKSVYISATKNDWDDAIEIRISDHTAKYSGADKYLSWEDFKNPAEALKEVKKIIENFE